MGVRTILTAVFVCVAAGAAFAQGGSPGTAASARSAAPAVEPTGIATPPGYVIGPEDVLTIFDRFEKDLNTDVNVRPDGKISLPLINDIQAGGLTPEQLRQSIETAATKFFDEPTVSVVVKAINSRKVFIQGSVAKQGAYPLLSSMTVLQLITNAGGFTEYASRDKIMIIREENGQQKSFKFNFNEVSNGRNLAQNIPLKPGDTVLVAGD